MIIGNTKKSWTCIFRKLLGDGIRELRLRILINSHENRFRNLISWRKTITKQSERMNPKRDEETLSFHKYLITMLSIFRMLRLGSELPILLGSWFIPMYRQWKRKSEWKLLKIRSLISSLTRWRQFQILDFRRLPAALLKKQWVWTKFRNNWRISNRVEMLKVIWSKITAHSYPILTPATNTYLSKIIRTFLRFPQKSSRPQFPLDIKNIRLIFRWEIKMLSICMVWRPRIENRPTSSQKLISRLRKNRSLLPTFQNIRDRPHRDRVLLHLVPRLQLPTRAIILRLIRKRLWKVLLWNQNIRKIILRSIYKSNNSNTKLTAKTYNSVNWTWLPSFINWMTKID